MLLGLLDLVLWECDDRIIVNCDHSIVCLAAGFCCNLDNKSSHHLFRALLAGDLEQRPGYSRASLNVIEVSSIPGTFTHAIRCLIRMQTLSDLDFRERA